MESNSFDTHSGNASTEDQNGSKEHSTLPNIIEVWKKLYFLSENTIGEIFKSTVSTDSFAKEMNHFLNYYLDFEKLFRKSLDHYFEINMISSKKDIARVAKLVIGVEDKLDSMEAGLERNLDQLVTNLMIIVDRMAAEKERTANREVEIVSINERLDTLSDNIDRLKCEVGELSNLLSHGYQERPKKSGASRKTSLKVTEDSDVNGQKVRNAAPVSEKDLQPALETTEIANQGGDLIEGEHNGDSPANENS